MKKWFIVSLGLISLCGCTPPSTASIQIKAMADTTILAGTRASENLGSAPTLQVSRGQVGAEGHAMGLIKFSLDELPATDQGVFLNVYVSDLSSPSDLMVWQSQRPDWNENTISYTTDPYIAAPVNKAFGVHSSVTPIPWTRVAITQSNQWVKMDITEAVRASKEQGVLSLYLMSGALGIHTPRNLTELEEGRIFIASRESEHAPYLSLSAAPRAKPETAAHPIVYIQEKDRADLDKKLATNTALKKRFDQIHERIDELSLQHAEDPEYLLSRMQLWWNDHHATTKVPGWTRPITECLDMALLPTIRWCSQATPLKDAPWNLNAAPLEQRKPYDDGDTIFAVYNNKLGDYPYATCGVATQAANGDLMNIAKEAAFLNWYTGEERYGKMAADLLWQLSMAVYFTNIPDHEFCGITATETIHDNAMAALPIAYDFLHPYLKKHQIPTEIMEFAMRRSAKNWLYRGHGSNWTIWETKHMSPIVHMVKDNEAYADGLGRSALLKHIYTDDVKNPAFNDKTTHESLATVMKQYDIDSGLKTESPGYSQGSSSFPVDYLAYLMNLKGEQEEADLSLFMEMPFNYFAWSDTVGGAQAFSDLPHRRKYDATVIELLARMAYAKGDTDYIKRLAALYQTLYPQSGNKGRKYKSIKDICLSNNLLVETEVTEAPSRPRSFYAPLQNNVLGRGSIGFGKHAGMITVYGEDVAGHDQRNGLAMECHFLGKPLLVDWGGSSYRQGPVKWHLTATPAHNTVVIRGFDCRRDLQHPVFNWVEPRLTERNNTRSAGAGINPFCNVIDASMNYDFKGTPARKDGATQYHLQGKQRRLVGMIRTSPEAVWFIDFFHSDETGAEDLFHDYVYNPLGDFIGAAKGSKKVIFKKVADDKELGELANEHEAYDYYTHRKKTSLSGGFWSFYKGADDFYVHAYLADNKAKRDTYVVTGYKSDVYGVDAIRGANTGDTTNRQACVIRQQGEAWDRPFVMAYEATDTSTRTIQQVVTDVDQPEYQAVSLKGSPAVDGQVVHVVHNLTPGIYTHAGIKFDAEYAVVNETEAGELSYLYLGEGRKLAYKGYALDAGDKTVSAGLRLEEGQRLYSQSVAAPIRITLPCPAEMETVTAITLTTEGETQTFPALLRGTNVSAELSFMGEDAEINIVP